MTTPTAHLLGEGLAWEVTACFRFPSTPLSSQDTEPGPSQPPTLLLSALFSPVQVQELLGCAETAQPCRLKKMGMPARSPGSACGHILLPASDTKEGPVSLVRSCSHLLGSLGLRRAISLSFSSLFSKVGAAEDLPIAGILAMPSAQPRASYSPGL